MRTIDAVLLCIPFALIPGCRSPASSAPHHASSAVVASDFDVLQGDSWSGTLTYLDYSSGKTTTIRSTLQVTRVAEGSWTFAVGYNDEPHANAADEVRLEQGGLAIRSGDSVEHVVGRTERTGHIEIVTEQPGEDNGTAAVIRRVRTIAPREYSLAKYVCPEGQETFFKRHEYRWARK